MKKRWAQCLAVFIIACASGYYLSTGRELLEILKELNPKSVAILVGISCLPLFINGLILKVLLHSFNICISVKESFAISYVNALGNYMVTRGGTIGKAVYLRKKHDFQYAAFIASMTAVYLISFLLASIIGAGSAVMISPTFSVLYPSLFWGFSIFGLLVLGVMVLPFNPPIRDGKILNLVSNIFEGWHLLRKNFRIVLVIGLLLLINYMITSAQLFLCYRAFSFDVNFSSAMFVAVVSTLSGVIRITPGNLGVEEGVIAFSSHLLGIGLGEGLLVAGLMRGISTAMVFLSAGIFGSQLFKEARQQDEPESEVLFRS